MPEPRTEISWDEEPVIFENWEEEGCHVFAHGKHVLTLNTPESTATGDPYNTFLDDWISPEEFCTTLEKVLRALGTSPAVIAKVESERRRYREHPIQPPTRTNVELMDEVKAMCA
ncbi:MAG: hypothetical protein DVB32_09650 [Verrucomicrobia bacterium]|nr:MAG: hypothetical protein DVB32_09650 [Verrucomicrobiota bacterium]